MIPDRETLAAYDAFAADYADGWLGQAPPTDLQDAVRTHFRSGAEGGFTADIGCGSGRDVDWLNRHGYPCVGFDASDALLAGAQARFPDWRFERTSLPRLDEISPRTFDNVVCETVLMHLPRDAIGPAIDHLRRILVANSDGLLTGDDQVRTRFMVYSVASAPTPVTVTKVSTNAMPDWLFAVTTRL